MNDASTPKQTKSLCKEWGGGLRNLVAASGAAAAMLPGPSRADGILGAGVFLGYQFGEHGRLDWGIEAFSTHYVRGEGVCESRPRAGFGPLLQVGLIGLSDPRVTLAVQGGGEFERSAWALTGELGLTYRMGQHGGLGLHTGVTGELTIFNAAIRYQWLLDEGWVGGGVRYFPTYGEPGICSVGRPYRTDCGRVHMRPAERIRIGARAGSPEDEEAEATGRGYERDAQLECASFPAFVQLAEELRLHDAPEALVQRALAATVDEMRHARMCARLATRHLRQPISAVFPPVAPRPPLAGSAGLVRLAVESWIDGCVMEEVAAAQALHAARVCLDAEARGVQQVIARDEHRHAELAWSILEWALQRGGEAARDALSANLDVGLAAAPPDLAPAGLERHGRLAASTLDQLALECHESSRMRMRAVLARA